ncbi:hypothetical protein [Halosegnis marinus]|uniref:hypothetical protein n=1 Tax=Halosegnis marinus TaxID=3034023 RepID=UPI00361B4B83
MVAALGLLVGVSFVATVAVQLGASPAVGLAAGVATAAGFAAAAYRRMVSERDSAAHREVPAESRLLTIVLGVVVVCAAMFGVSLLLYLG